MSRSAFLCRIGPAFCLAALLVFCFAAHAAQTPQAVVRAPVASGNGPAADNDSPGLAEIRAAMKANAIPLSVEHAGNDTLGAKLAVQLKEAFNTGTLLALNDNDVPKLQMLVSTSPEFSSRPAAGSVYSVIWVYSERSNVLGNYLAHECGILTPEDLDGLAARLVSRTAGLTAKHAYIFKK